MLPGEVYDVSRGGRFQDTDESAHYEFLCRRAEIAVPYCAEQFENDGRFGNHHRHSRTASSNALYQPPS